MILSYKRITKTVIKLVCVFVVRKLPKRLNKKNKLLRCPVLEIFKSSFCLITSSESIDRIRELLNKGPRTSCPKFKSM